MKTILELADDYAKAYFMGRGEEARKLLQAAIINAETAGYLSECSHNCRACGLHYTPKEGGSEDCPRCGSDGKVPAQSTSDQLRDEYRSGLDSPDNTPEGEEG